MNRFICYSAIFSIISMPINDDGYDLVFFYLESETIFSSVFYFQEK